MYCREVTAAEELARVTQTTQERFADPGRDRVADQVEQAEHVDAT